MYECCPTHLTEIESIDELRRYIEANGALTEVVVQGLDLTDDEAEAAVTSVSAEDACFLGCRLTDAAVDTLAAAPHYEDTNYIDRAMAVRERYPNRTESLAVPTWFYGHEPSNLFPTHVAKYFANSIREDGLLAIAQYGVIYAPGSAGTIQEVFMDTAQNHYETSGAASPMVFLDEHYWTDEKPVYPLLQTLAEDTPYADELCVTDDVDTVAAAIADHAPTRPS